MSVYDRISDRTRPWETVWDRTRPYIQPHMKSTPRVSSTVSISYINVWNRVKPFPSPTSNTRINTRMSHDHRTIHTSVHTVLYDRHTTNTVSYDRHSTNTVQVRIIHGQVRPDTVCTSVQSSCMIIHRVSYWPNMTLLLSHSLVQTCLFLLLLLSACSCLPSRLLAKIISMSISLIMISNSLILSRAIF